MRVLITLILSIIFIVSAFASCDCGRIYDTFLPIAKRKGSVTLYVEVIGLKQISREYDRSMEVVQLKVLENLNSVIVYDIVNLLTASPVECCLTSLGKVNIGDRAVICAYQWLGGQNDFRLAELDILCLSVCQVSKIMITNDIATGPITRNRQSMRIEELLARF